MSEVVKRVQCPECAKNGNDKAGDNLIVYQGGSAFCFACGYSVKSKRDRNEQTTKTKKNRSVLTLPEHFIPLQHLGYKYDIPKSVLEKCGVYESPLFDKKDNPIDNVEGNVAFTFFDAKLRLIGIKYRDFLSEYEDDADKNDCIWTQGTIGLGGLLTCSRIKKDAKAKSSVCIWEGETDWLIAHKMDSKCDHLFIPGARHTKKLKEHAMLLRRYRTIYIGFDNDDAGDIARDEVKDILPAHKLRFVQYDNSNDLVEYINRGGNFSTLLSKAYSDEESDLLTGKDLIEHCDNYFTGLNKTEILSTGIELIDEMLGGGLSPSEIVIITANTGVGKSTLCATIADNMTEEGVRSLWIGSEMQPAQMMRKFIELRTGQRYYYNKRDEEWSIPDDIRDEVITELSEDIVFYRQRMSDWEVLEESILTAIYQYDVHVIFIDVMTDYLTSEWQKNEEIMQRLAWIAAGDEEDGRAPIPIIIVCHTREIQGTSSKKVTVARIAGGKCVSQKATAIIAMEGDVTSMETTRKLKVLKGSRMNETIVKSGSIYFDRNDRTYYDLDEEEARPTQEEQIKEELTPKSKLPRRRIKSE